MIVVEEKGGLTSLDNVKQETNSLLLDSGSKLPAAPASSNTTTKTIKCPECGSQKVWKDGIRYTHFGETQRYICRECSYRFSQSDYSEPSEHHQRIHTLILKNKASKHILCQIGAAQLTGAKNLAEVETRIQEKAAGATTTSTPDQATMRGKILEFGLWLQKQGHRESTVESYMTMLTTIMKRGFNILDPENVKEAISKQLWCEQRKGVFVEVYKGFLKMLGKPWTPPTYTTKTQKLPYIPSESDVDLLIAACRRKLGIFTQLIKETGMRPGEAWNLKWIDCDFQRRIVSVRPEKGSNPRMLPLSQQLINRMDLLPKGSEYVFRKGLLRHWQSNFWQARQTLSRKLGNPRIMMITWKSLRHLKGTMAYHQTKDILHVKQTLGHVNINNTLIYIHLENALFQNTSDEFHVKAAKTAEEAKQLLEVGFEYVCTTPENLMLLRKRK